MSNHSVWWKIYDSEWLPIVIVAIVVLLLVLFSPIRCELRITSTPIDEIASEATND